MAKQPSNLSLVTMVELHISAPEVTPDVNGMFSGPCFGDRTPSASSVTTSVQTPSPSPPLTQGLATNLLPIRFAGSLGPIVPSPSFLTPSFHNTQDINIQLPPINFALRRDICAETDQSLPGPSHAGAGHYVRHAGGDGIPCITTACSHTSMGVRPDALIGSVLTNTHEVFESNFPLRETSYENTCQLQDDIPSQIEHANLPTSSPSSSSPPHIFSSPPPFSSQVSAPSSPDKFSPLQTERKLVLRLPALSVGFDATKNDVTLDLPAALDPMNPTNIALGLGDYGSKISATTSAKSSQTLSLPDLPDFSSPSGAGLTHSLPAPRVAHLGDHLDNITPLDSNWSAKSTSPSDSLIRLSATSNCLLPSLLTTNEYLVPLDQHPLRSVSPLLDMSSPIINLAAVTDAQNDEQDLDPKQSVLNTTPLGSFGTTCQRLIEDDPESPAATSTGLVLGDPPRAMSPQPNPTSASSSTVPSDSLNTSLTTCSSNTTSKSSDDTTDRQSAMDSPQPKITTSTSIDNSQQANTKNKTRWAMGTDEPTPSLMSVPTTGHSMTGKRKREDEAISHGSHDVATSHIDSPTRRPEIPNPKRPTQAAQRLQRQKLTTPFRSPVVRKVTASTEATRKTLPLPQAAPTGAKSENHASGNGSGLEEAPRISELDTKKRHRTTRAAAQFKSPLSTQASTGMPSIRLTPTIQSLDRKIQILKRALKVKQGNEEAMLESLVKKWKEAGREVAWEVWELVKDNASSDDSVWGKSKAKQTSFGGSWGWDSQEEQSWGAQKERNWGWDTTPNTGTDDGPRHMSEETKVETDDEEKVQDTLGTMLRQLGIDPDTLGWNEDEGTFVDKDEQ